MRKTIISNLKQSVKKFRRRTYEFWGNPRYSRPAMNDMDRKLEKYLNFRSGFFIEVGANNGYSQSNTYYLEKMLGWKGILVEPLPDLYQRCRKERAQSLVLNYALVNADYPESSIDLHYADLMSAVEGSMKTNEGLITHIEKGLANQDLDHSFTLKVPTRTLESILNELPTPVPIDFLSLDVEGYELNVLQGMNLDRYPPRFILVEARYFDEVDHYLARKYRLLEQMSHHDFFYQLK